MLGVSGRLKARDDDDRYGVTGGSSDGLFRAPFFPRVASPIGLSRASFDLVFSARYRSVIATRATDPRQHDGAPVHRGPGHNRALGPAEIAGRGEPETDWGLWHRPN